jgi:threonine dehydratase
LSPAEYLLKMRESGVYNVAIKSPFEHAPLLSKRSGSEVFLKREDLQPVFSFKLRGAYSAIAKLSAEELAKGVICASAGNHAQGVALAAQKLGTKALIVVPVTTPELKQQAIIQLGAELICFGDTYDDANLHARELAITRGMTFIHPYDDPDVIAGQGTIGLELHDEMPEDIDAVFVAVGGGGLISGVALALKQLRPGIKIIGVEPEDSDAMFRSLAAGERVILPRVGLFADGVAVRQVGEETFRLAQEFVDEVMLVSNDAICAAVKEVFEDRRAILEPAGALAIAGLRAFAKKQTGKYVAIACGANVNFDRLRYIAEQAALGEQSEAIFAVKIPEKPGSFKLLCETLEDRNITEFNYRMGNLKDATVFVGMQIKGESDIERVLQKLDLAGFAALDLSQNDLAKTHVRHMVGGRSSDAVDERLFHFDFPERPGALSKFLNALGGGWNISLFHYRNHGSDKGRVLAGIQVPFATDFEFDEFLVALGYDYVEETDNPVRSLFL